MSFSILSSGLLLNATVDREGDKYPDDDDVLSSGQISPLSVYILSCYLNVLLKNLLQVTTAPARSSSIPTPTARAPPMSLLPT